MESSQEDAILMLKKWKENASKLRIVFGSGHAQMTLYGTLANVTSEAAWAHGTHTKEDLQISFAGAKFAFADERGIPSVFKESLRSARLDEVVSIAWADDGTRVTILLEKE